MLQCACWTPGIVGHASLAWSQTVISQIERADEEGFEGLARLAGDVDPDLVHDVDRLGPDEGCLGAGAEGLESVAAPRAEHALRHLAARAVMGAHEDDALRIGAHGGDSELGRSTPCEATSMSTCGDNLWITRWPEPHLVEKGDCAARSRPVTL